MKLDSDEPVTERELLAIYAPEKLRGRACVCPYPMAWEWASVIDTCPCCGGHTTIPHAHMGKPFEPKRVGE